MKTLAINSSSSSPGLNPFNAYKNGVPQKLDGSGYDSRRGFFLPDIYKDNKYSSQDLAGANSFLQATNSQRAMAFNNTIDQSNEIRIFQASGDSLQSRFV